MIRTALHYHAPSDLEEAVRMAAQFPGAILVGGGTMVVPSMTRGETNSLNAIHLNRAGLRYISTEPEMIRVGAMSTYSDLNRSEAIRSLGVLSTATSGITGGHQIRNQGTIGGSAAYANPSSDIPGCLVALEASLVLNSSRGVRTVAAEQFYIGAFRTVAEPDEIVSEIRIPRQEIESSYYKFKLSESSWPVVTASCVLSRWPTCRLRIVVAAACAVPKVIDASELLVDGDSIDPVAAAELLPALVDAALQEGWSDVLATAQYRIDIAPVVARRALQRLTRTGAEQ